MPHRDLYGRTKEPYFRGITLHLSCWSGCALAVFGYTHKDPERVYKLSRVKVCAPKTGSAIQKPDQAEITCLTVYTITPMH